LGKVFGAYYRKNIDTLFFENLRSALDYSGLQVKELAKETGISEGTIYNYFNGRVKMPAADASITSH
jgi:transcriptional regulator with XRE-family HTH domain